MTQNLQINNKDELQFQIQTSNKDFPQQSYLNIRKEDGDQISQKHVYKNDLINKSRTKQNEVQRQDDQGENEEFDVKFALLDAENSLNIPYSVLKTKNSGKKKSLDSWDQEEPGFTDVRSFGNKLSAFKAKQFGYPAPQYRQNQSYRFGNRSNFRLGGADIQQRYVYDRNYKDKNGGLQVASQRFTSNQSLSPIPTDITVGNQIQSLQTSNLQNNSSINLNKQQDLQNSNQNILKFSVDNSDITQDIININDQNRDDNDKQTNQLFKKWEKDEQNEDSFLNNTKKKYGLSSNTSVVQINSNLLHNFQICPSLQTPLVYNEMKIFGNSFSCLKKNQENQGYSNNNVSLPLVKSSNLKKVNLNTNVQIPTEGNSQVLFPSSLNINLHLPMNQQQILSEQQRQKQTQLTNKYYINYPRINPQKEGDNSDNQNQQILINNEQIDNFNNQQNYENIINFPQIDLNSQRTLSDLMFEQENKDNFQRAYNGIQHKQIQVFNMDTVRITPIHSERVYYQIDSERNDEIQVNNERVGHFEMKLNNPSSLKSQSLSPLRFPRPKPIPPMKMKYKKKGREENSSDFKVIQSQLNGNDNEENNLSSKILSIKNIKPQQKNQQLKQLILPQTNIHDPIQLDQLDSLLKIISPSLCSSSQKVPEIKSDQLINNNIQSNEEQDENQNNIKENENDKIEDVSIKINDVKKFENLDNKGNEQNGQGYDENTKDESENNTNNLLNVPQVNTKMKVYQLRYKGEQQGKQVLNDESGMQVLIQGQKQLKQKHGISPRSISPHRSLQNQNQINKMASLAVYQYQNQYDKKDNKGYLLDQQLDKKDINNQFNLQKQEIFYKQKGTQNAIISNIKFSSTSNQHHIDFMDYVQGKSANIMNKSQLQNSNKAEVQIYKQNQNNKSEENDLMISKNISKVSQNTEQINLIKKVNSYSKFVERKLSPSPVRKLKTDIMPNSQSHTNINLTFNVNVQNQVNHINSNQNLRDSSSELTNQNKQQNQYVNNEDRGNSIHKKTNYNKEKTILNQNKKYTDNKFIIDKQKK